MPDFSLQRGWERDGSECLGRRRQLPSVCGRRRVISGRVSDPAAESAVQQAIQLHRLGQSGADDVFTSITHPLPGHALSAGPRPLCRATPPSVGPRPLCRPRPHRLGHSSADTGLRLSPSVFYSSIPFNWANRGIPIQGTQPPAIVINQEQTFDHGYMSRKIRKFRTDKFDT